MPAVVYGLCALTSALCAVLLWRSYVARPARLLLWSSIGFVGLFLNNLLLFVDLVAAPGMELSIARHLTAAAAVTIMLFGLLWEGR
jgi:hydrogenase/urease accessory protein HupE